MIFLISLNRRQLNAHRLKTSVGVQFLEINLGNSGLIFEEKTKTQDYWGLVKKGP
jgi:hypothetical protein